MIVLSNETEYKVKNVKVHIENILNQLPIPNDFPEAYKDVKDILVYTEIVELYNLLKEILGEKDENLEA